jgi:hypothetical protein
MNLSLTPPNIFKDRRLFFESKKSISESDLSKIVDQSQILIKTEIHDFDEMIAFSEGEIDPIYLEEDDSSSRSESDDQENLSSDLSSSSDILGDISYSDFIGDLLPKMNPIDFDFQGLLNSTNNLTMLINTYKEYVGTECDFLHFLMDNYSDQEYMESWTWRIYGKINDSHTFSDIILDVLDNWNGYCDEGDEKYQLHIIRDDEYCYDASIFDCTGDSFNIYSDDSPVCIYTVSLSREEAYELIDMAYYNNNIFFNSRDLTL